MYGVLLSNVNTGLNSELAYIFASPVSIYSNNPAWVADSMSLIRKAGEAYAQRFEIEANVSQTSDPGVAYVHMMEYGYNKVFYTRVPQPYIKDDPVENLTLTLGASVIAGATEVNISGLGTNKLRAGVFINIGSDPKLYLVKREVSAGVYAVLPEIRTSQASGLAVKYGKKTTMRAYYADDISLGLSYQDGILMGINTVRILEAL